MSALGNHCEEPWRHALFAVVSALGDRTTNNFHIAASFASLLGPRAHLVRQHATRFHFAHLDTSSQHCVFVKRRRVPPSCLLSRPWRKTSKQGPAHCFQPSPTSDTDLHSLRGLVSSPIESAPLLSCRLAHNSRLCPLFLHVALLHPLQPTMSAEDMDVDADDGSDKDVVESDRENQQDQNSGVRLEDRVGAAHVVVSQEPFLHSQTLYTCLLTAPVSLRNVLHMSPDCRADQVTTMSGVHKGRRMAWKRSSLWV